MNKYKDFIAAAIFMVVVLAVWLGVSALPSPGLVEAPVNGGVFDLSAADFDDTVYVPVGDWRSYPEQLYTPADLDAAGPPAPSGSLDYTKARYVTHVMTLHIPAGHTYGVIMRSADYSMRLYINGEEVDLVGFPGDSAVATVPRVLNRVYSFAPDTDTTEIVMQAANFVHHDGAQPPRFVIGRFEDIYRRVKADDMITFLVMGCLLAGAMYHLGQFALNRKRKTTLLFALCCLLFALLSNDIYTLFPDYNWQIAIRFEYFVHFAVFAFTLLFLDRLRPGVLRKTVTRVYYGIAAVYVAMLALDSVIFTTALVAFEVASVLLIAYVFVMFAISAAKERDAVSFLSLLGVSMISILGIDDLLSHMNVRFLGYLLKQGFNAPLGMLFFMFCYGLIVAMDYAETERKAVAAAVENDALSRMNRMKSDLIATIAHETKTPLAVLSTYAGLVALGLRGKGVDEQTAKDLDTITDETKRIAVLMDELQDVSRKHDMPVKTRLNLAELINGLARLYTPMLVRAGAELSIDVPADLPDVYACAGEITQVLYNLLQNARRHGAGGAVSVTAVVAGGFARVTVKDGGAGIAPEMLPRVFERGVSEDGGDGLGLAICREIIEDHSGEITIESIQGKGTAATFTLPIWKGGGAHE